MEIDYREIGVCGLSCRLCPRFHTQGESRCGGCKSETRMAAGCPFHTCALKRHDVEFCWECAESDSCERWAGHRQYGRSRDTFVCYAALEDNIACISRDGLPSFAAEQVEREGLLREMLADFNESRSKSYYCIAATVLTPSELRSALRAAHESADDAPLRDRAKAMHALLDSAAAARSIQLKSRK